MTVLHKRGKCWCSEEHSANQQYDLNKRDTTVRQFPALPKEGPWAAKGGPKKGRPRKNNCACECRACRRSSRHGDCKNNCRAA